jgi:hypothetical protein
MERNERDSPEVVNPDKHECNFRWNSGGYGPAITTCWEDENNALWVGNGEYSSQVNYCPNCRFESRYDIYKDIKE